MHPFRSHLLAHSGRLQLLSGWLLFAMPTICRLPCSRAELPSLVARLVEALDDWDDGAVRVLNGSWGAPAGSALLRPLPDPCLPRQRDWDDCLRRALASAGGRMTKNEGLMILVWGDL